MTFTALPAGWYNYYSEIDNRGDRRVYRNPCPGILGIPIGTDMNFKAAEFDGADLIDAESNSYLGTYYGEEFWQEVGKAPNEEAVSA